MSNAVTGGSGAPIYSESGRMLVPLHEDPQITFSESTRNFVEKDLRYRKTPMEQSAYRQDLDRMIEEKKRQKYNDRFGGGGLPAAGYKNQNYDSFNDSWGRPGPGDLNVNNFHN